jgi:hypothetical protein
MTERSNMSLSSDVESRSIGLLRNLRKFTEQLLAAAHGEEKVFSAAERVYAVSLIEAGMFATAPGIESVADGHRIAAVAAAKALANHDGVNGGNPFDNEQLRVAYSSQQCCMQMQ